MYVKAQPMKFEVLTFYRRLSGNVLLKLFKE